MTVYAYVSAENLKSVLNSECSMFQVYLIQVH